MDKLILAIWGSQLFGVSQATNNSRYLWLYPSLLKARSLKRQRHSEQGSFSRHKLLDQPIDPRTVLDVGTATGTRQKHHHNVTWQETDTALLYHWGAVRKEERRDIKEEKCKHFWEHTGGPQGKIPRWSCNPPREFSPANCHALEFQLALTLVIWTCNQILSQTLTPLLGRPSVVHCSPVRPFMKAHACSPGCAVPSSPFWSCVRWPERNFFPLCFAGPKRCLLFSL